MIFLDTHVVVWLYAGLVGKLSPTAAGLIEENDLRASLMVRLEIQYLYEIKRISVDADTVLRDLNESIGLKVMDQITMSTLDTAMHYSWARDVFDRLITAESDSFNSVLVTKDQSILDNYSMASW